MTMKMLQGTTTRMTMELTSIFIADLAIIKILQLNMSLIFQANSNVAFADVSPILTNTNDCVINQDLLHDNSSFGLEHRFDPAGEIEGAMNEGMYSNQTFDSSRFQNDTNQHLLNMAPSPFPSQSSTYPELTEAEICNMTGDQLNDHWHQFDSNPTDSNMLTPHSTQTGQISHTIPAMAPSDSFSMQNEYTHPQDGTRGAYPPSLSTVRARCQNLLHQDNDVLNDVLDQNDLLQQELAQLGADYQRVTSSKSLPCCHWNGNGGHGSGNRGRDRMDGGGRTINRLI